MSKNWMRSNLRIGEELRISNHLFILGEIALKRVESIIYLGETDSGIMIDCKFKSSIKNGESYHYRMMVNWASIWAGQVKIYAQDGSLVMARRMKGQPIAYEVMKI